MIRLALVLAALALLSGCDAVADPGHPGWSEAGARLVYDYTPGPDSLRIGSVPLQTRRALPATPAVLQMTVRESLAYGDTEASWTTPDGSVPVYEYHYALPLNGEYLTVTERGVEVVIPRGCQGGFLSSPAGTTNYVRVPRVGADSQAYVPCSLQPATGYRMVGTETVTTPAGTFETYIFEIPFYSGSSDGVAREYWNYDTGLIRHEILNEARVLRGHLDLAASNRL